MRKLDGNAMAGDLREIFAVEMTEARFTCAGCGRAEAIGTLMLWGQEMGRVARCPHCDDVVLRMVRAADRVFLDLRGALRLEVPLEAPLGAPSEAPLAGA
ncbi:DUF6510 family protein [Actinoplanes sp. CA-030573]|uniref:DUF6510 family protein n=1 Tax=Actinoplanes sp. CA-030573 TaxID=3239898 RepID=UPI003D89C3CB